MRTAQANPGPLPSQIPGRMPSSLTVGEWVMFLWSFWKERNQG